MAKRRVTSIAQRKQDAETSHPQSAETYFATRRDARQDVLDLQRSAGNRAVGRLRAPLKDDPAPYPVESQEVIGAVNSGRPLPESVKQAVTVQLGQDLSGVAIHDDVQSDYVAKALDAEAVSVGRHILFRRGNFQPGSPTGQELLAHEARHIAAGTATGGTAGAQPVQLQVTMDDVTEEMVGKPFTLRSEQGLGANQIPKAARVIVTDWRGVSSVAEVEYHRPDGSVVKAEISKLALQPDTPTVPGMRPYRVGLEGQQKAVEKADKSSSDQQSKVDEWKAKEGNYKKNQKFWEKERDSLDQELSRRNEVQADKESTLSQMLQLETMYNTFDPQIKQWVDYYNKAFKPDKELDPNIVKSMIFEESRMGTHGEHLEMPPLSWAADKKHPLRSRWNIGQAIDSRAEQQLIMLKEMAPAIFSKYGLDVLEKQNKRKGMTLAEFAGWEGGKFALAVREFFEARDASNKNLMDTKGHDLHEDYGFWIRTAIRWLFQKYMSLPEKNRTWEEAVRAYNGSGPGARNYKKKVMSRVDSLKDLDVGMK